MTLNGLLALHGVGPVHKHSCTVEGSFWALYFTCRSCGEVRMVDRDGFYALTVQELQGSGT